MIAESPRPRVTILLCTFNGAAHLREQLASYLVQDHMAWDLWVSDDGSTDETWAILEEFQASQAGRHDVHLLHGPCEGSTVNFLSLLCHPDLPLGPVALSDQDDVWMPGKLSRALDFLARGGPVALYGGQYLVTDDSLSVIGQSRAPGRTPSFANALAQNIISGHSATLSTGALALVRAAGRPEDVPYHDWWLYQLISGAGGDVIIDDQPVLYYRQHSNNLLGAHHGVGATLKRITMILNRTYSAWLEANTAALHACSWLLTPDNTALLNTLTATPQRPGLTRPRTMRELGVHRQHSLITASLYLAAAIGRA